MNGNTEIIEAIPIDFSDSDAIKQKIENFAVNFAYSDVEYALIISQDGQAYTLAGTDVSVDVSIIGEDVLIGSIGIHTHPVSPGQTMGDSFSRTDLYIATNYNQGKQFLVSGERRNAFEFAKAYTEDEIYSAWVAAENKLFDRGFSGTLFIEWWHEEVMKILDQDLEGFSYYEDF